MAMSNFSETAVLDHILTATAYTSPNATLHLGLLVAGFLDGSPAAGEVDAVADDTAYARQPISFDAAVAGNLQSSSESSNTQTFPAVVHGTNAADYNVTHFAIYDALVAGNVIYWAPLSASILRQVGKTLVFDTGNVTVVQS